MCACGTRAVHRYIYSCVAIQTACFPAEVNNQININAKLQNAFEVRQLFEGGRHGECMIRIIKKKPYFAFRLLDNIVNPIGHSCTSLQRNINFMQ